MSDEKIPAKENVNVLALKDSSGGIAVYDYGVHAGVGMEFADQGGNVPFLSLLQPLSKALVEGHENYIPEAKSGMFCIASTKQVFSGKEGVNFIGIAETHSFTEKTSLAADGKWVAEHAVSSPEVAKARASSGGSKKGLKMANGNVLVETYKMYGVIVKDFARLNDPSNLTPVCVSFERSKMKGRTRIMEKLRSEKRSIPLYAVKLKLTSFLDKDRSGANQFPNIKPLFAVDDDMLKSLILPNDPLWAEWGDHCLAVAKGVSAGSIQGDKRTEVSGAAPGGEGGEDVPF